MNTFVIPEPNIDNAIKFDKQLDLVRRAGVRRGINAAIADIEAMAKNATDAEVLTLIKVIRQLNTLTVDIAENN